MRHVFAFIAHAIPLVPATDQNRKHTARVRQTYFERGKRIEYAAKDKMCGGDCRFNRIANQIAELELLETIVPADHHQRSVMQKDGQSERRNALIHGEKHTI